MIVQHFDKLSHSRGVSLAASRATTILVERFDWRYPWSWSHPVVAVMDGEDCRAFLQYEDDPDNLEITITLAWCDPAWPTALTIAAAAFRRRLDVLKGNRVAFTHHAGNAPMTRLAALLTGKGARMRSIAYEIPVDRLRTKKGASADAGPESGVGTPTPQ